MPDYSSFPAPFQPQLADLEARKAVEIGKLFGIKNPEDERLKSLAAEIMETVISTLKAASTPKQRLMLSTLAMSKSLARTAVAKHLRPMSELPGPTERKIRDEIELEITKVIESIVPAIDICLNPPKPQPTRPPVYGQGKARKRNRAN